MSAKVYNDAADDLEIDQKSAPCVRQRGGRGSDSRLRWNKSEKSPQISESLKLRPLSVRQGESLRGEFTYESKTGKTGAETVGQALETFERKRKNVEESWAHFKNTETGEVSKKKLLNRWDSEYSDISFGKLKNLAQGLHKQFGDSLQQTMLTLTGSSKNANGGLRCPVDHFEDVTETQSAVIDKLRYELAEKRGIEFEYIWVREPHDSGYAHSHLVIWTGETVLPPVFRKAIDKHTQKCNVAGTEAHADAIDVSTVGETGINSIASYLAEYLGVFADHNSLLDAPDNIQIFEMMLYATGKRRFSMSEGARKLSRDEYESYKDESDEESEWEFVGISFGSEDEADLVPAEELASGGASPYVKIAGREEIDPPPIIT